MVTIRGGIRAISVSKQKGTPKHNVPTAELLIDHGVVGDAHADGGHRQVSLLATEAIETMRARGAEVLPGDFAENITVENLDLSSLPIGCRLGIGIQAELEVTQRGKQCHRGCAILERLGDCIMPRQGLFARVTRSGPIEVGDSIEVIDDHGCHTDG